MTELKNLSRRKVLVFREVKGELGIGFEEEMVLEGDENNIWGGLCLVLLYREPGELICVV